MYFSLSFLFIFVNYILPLLFFLSLFLEFYFFYFGFFNYKKIVLVSFFIMLLLEFFFVAVFSGLIMNVSSILNWEIVFVEGFFIFVAYDVYWGFYQSIIKIFILIFGICIVFFFEDTRDDFTMGAIKDAPSCFNIIPYIWHDTFKFTIIYVFVYCSTVILFISNLFLIYILFEIMTVCLIFMVLTKGLRTTEFILKYYNYLIFVEILLLFGFCLFYIVFGTLDIIDILIFNTVCTSSFDFFIYYISLFLIVFSFLFKIGIFPFHFYIIDLYNNCDFSTILLFSTLPKFIYFYFLDIILKIFFYGFKINYYYHIFFLDYMVAFFFMFIVCSLLFANGRILGSFTFMDILAYSSVSFYSLLLLPFFAPIGHSFDFFYSVGLFLLIMYSFNLILFLYFLYIFGFFALRREISIAEFTSFVDDNLFVFLLFLFFILTFSGLPFFLGFFIKFFFYSIFLKGWVVSLYFLFSISFTFSFFFGIRLFRFLLFDLFSNFPLWKSYFEFSFINYRNRVGFYVFICLVFLFIVFCGLFFFFF